MHEHLESLLEIQDLKTQRAELAGTEQERLVEEEVFHVSIEEALRMLEQKIEEMEGALPQSVRQRYRKLAGRYPRVVVPVIGGTCYGCFVSVATALSSHSDRNEALQVCENCGRFLYLIN